MPTCRDWPPVSEPGSDASSSRLGNCAGPTSLSCAMPRMQSLMSCHVSQAYTTTVRKCHLPAQPISRATAPSSFRTENIWTLTMQTWTVFSLSSVNNSGEKVCRRSANWPQPTSVRIFTSGSSLMLPRTQLGPGTLTPCVTQQSTQHPMGLAGVSSCWLRRWA